MADEADSKSVVGNHVRVQVPLPAEGRIAERLSFYRCFGDFLLLLKILKIVFTVIWQVE
jgi:hypothetical protein